MYLKAELKTMYIKISWILRNQLILFQNRIDQKFIMEKGMLIKAETIKKEKHSFWTKTYIFKFSS